MPSPRARSRCRTGELKSTSLRGGREAARGWSFTPTFLATRPESAHAEDRARRSTLTGQPENRTAELTPRLSHADSHAIWGGGAAPHIADRAPARDASVFVGVQHRRIGRLGRAERRDARSRDATLESVCVSVSSSVPFERGRWCRASVANLSARLRASPPTTDIPPPDDLARSTRSFTGFAASGATGRYRKVLGQRFGRIRRLRYLPDGARRFRRGVGGFGCARVASRGVSGRVGLAQRVFATRSPPSTSGGRGRTPRSPWAVPARAGGGGSTTTPAPPAAPSLTRSADRVGIAGRRSTSSSIGAAAPPPVGGVVATGRCQRTGPFDAPRRTPPRGLSIAPLAASRPCLAKRVSA